MHRILAKSGDDRRVNGWYHEFFCSIFGEKNGKNRGQPTNIPGNLAQVATIFAAEYCQKGIQKSEFLACDSRLAAPSQVRLPTEYISHFLLTAKMYRYLSTQIKFYSLEYLHSS